MSVKMSKEDTLKINASTDLTKFVSNINEIKEKDEKESSGDNTDSDDLSVTSDYLRQKTTRIETELNDIKHENGKLLHYK